MTSAVRPVCCGEAAVQQRSHLTLCDQVARFDLLTSHDTAAAFTCVLLEREVTPNGR